MIPKNHIICPQKSYRLIPEIISSKIPKNPVNSMVSGILTLNLLCIYLGVWGNSPPNRRGRSPLALLPVYSGSLHFFWPLWLADSQEPGSILLTQNLHPSPYGAFLTAGIFAVLRLRRQREADVPSAPRRRFAIVRRKPPPLENDQRQFAGRSPLHPPPLQKADGLRPRLDEKSAGMTKSWP